MNVKTQETPDEEPESVEIGFDGLGLCPELLEALNDLGYEEPTPIQRATMPLLIGGADLLGQAATGTGKTAAFALPALQAIGANAAAVPSVLVVVPTRELAVQVSEAMFKYGRKLGIKVCPVFGGQPIYRQLKSLKRGVHVVVATPGRAVDLINRGALELGAIRTVVLDEADEMLDMGFADDIEAILKATPDDRQTVLFSATMPARITSIAKRYQRSPERIEIGRRGPETSNALVRQSVYFVQRRHKPTALGRVLDIEGPTAAIVFCRTRIEVDELTATMSGRGYRAEALHGGLDQQQRDRVMGRLKSGSAELLIATDVAARGLDVDSLTHVVNYDVPSAAESYVHRIGRVGRAGRSGVAITLAEPKEKRLLANIERLTKQKIPVERVPSVADLRSKQIDVTVAAIREELVAEDLPDFDGVLEALGTEDQRVVTLAAIKLLHEARGASQDEVEIPEISPQNDRGKGKRNKRDRNKNGREKKKGGSTRRPGDSSPGFLYISVGRNAGVRPADLVGAIANEAGLPGRDVGPIRISDNFSVVGIPEDAVADACKAMSSTSVRGKKAKVRRYVE